jgi:hypothetical protein
MGVSGQRHAPAALYPQGKNPRYQLVGPRAGLDAGARRKVICPCRGSNLDHPIVQPVVRHYTAWATAALVRKPYLPQIPRPLRFFFLLFICCIPCASLPFDFCGQIWSHESWSALKADSTKYCTNSLLYQIMRPAISALPANLMAGN